MIIVVVSIQYTFIQYMNKRVFIFLYPAMFAGIVLGPLKSSFLAVILATLSLCFLFLEPIGSFKIDVSADIIAVVFFLFTGLAFIYLNERQSKINIKHSMEKVEQFKTLANSMPQLVWMANADGFIFWYNEGWYKYTGTTSGDMEGWGWQSVHHPDTLPVVMEKWPESIQSGEPFEMEFPLRGTDGTYKWFLTRALPIKDAKGGVISWFGTNTDIDTQKTISLELNRAILLRDEFLTLASHEFRTPITSLKMQIQMFQRQINLEKETGPSIKKQHQYLNVSSIQVDRLNLLVDELLDVSRIDSGKLKYDFIRFELTGFVESLVEKFADDFESSGCTVSFEGNGTIYVFADLFRLEQVLVNIFINAMKYASGKPVTISVMKTNSLAKIIIEDRGIGIDEKYLTHIFKRFERAITHKNISGLGLGLYIAKEMMLAQHGDIFAQSKIGEGSTFFVTLPCAPSEVSPPTTT